MKQQEHNSKAIGQGANNAPPSLAELKAIRLAQKAANQRLDDLKMKLFRISEQHMDQVVSLVRHWLDASKK